MSPLIETLVDLVRIDSVNPEWGGPGEGRIADYVESFLGEAGIKTNRSEVLPGRENVIARIPGEDRTRSLLLEAHMDTVSAAGMSIDPFAAKLSDGRLWGRGSCDTKAGLAAMLHAMVAINSDNQKPAIDIILAAVVDEEHLFRGVLDFIRSLNSGELPSGAIVAEPTELRPVRATKGVLRWCVSARGRSAHSSTPHLGASAISAMADVIKAIDSDPPTGNHDLVGPPTCSIGTIQGGRQINFVPDECRIQIDRRMIPGESAAEVHNYHDGLLNPARELHPDVRIENESPFVADEAMETPADESIVRAASEVLTSIDLPSDSIGVPFGCDASKLSRAGIPSIVFGPGSIDRAHTADEYVEIDQVEKASEFYRNLIMRFNGT